MDSKTLAYAPFEEATPVFVEPQPCWHELGGGPLGAAESQKLIDLQRSLRAQRLRGNLQDVRHWVAQGALSEQVLRNARAVGLFVAHEVLERQGIEAVGDSFDPFLTRYREVLELLPEDHLANEWRWARVSGSCFLVAPDRVLSAAHTIGKSAMNLIEKREFHVVFDFQTPPVPQAPAVMSKQRSVFTVTGIHRGGEYESPRTDWITLELDRPVDLDRRPLRLAREPVDVSRPVYTLGHPKAIAMRYARSQELWRSAFSGCYEAHLDAYDGVSGSPVLDAATHQVLGMLIRSCPNKEGQVLTYRDRFLSPLCYGRERKCGAVIVSAPQFAAAV
jgi:hypothetical protein